MKVVLLASGKLLIILKDFVLKKLYFQQNLSYSKSVLKKLQNISILLGFLEKWLAYSYSIVAIRKQQKADTERFLARAT